MSKNMSVDFDFELAIKLSEIVEKHCPDAPFDIGAILAKEVFLHDLSKAGKQGADVGTKLKEALKNNKK